MIKPTFKILGKGGVTTRDKIPGKVKDQGMTRMFVGYAESHSNNVFRMLILKAHWIINSIDIIWLSKSHEKWLNEKVIYKQHFNDDDNEFEQNNVEILNQLKKDPSKRSVRKKKTLQDSESIIKAIR